MHRVNSKFFQITIYLLVIFLIIVIYANFKSINYTSCSIYFHLINPNLSLPETQTTKIYLILNKTPTPTTEISVFDTEDAQWLFDIEANTQWFPSGIKGDNITGYPYLIVPNIVHYIALDSTELLFVNYISIKSVLRHQKPDKIMIHCNCDEMTGNYWLRLKDEIRETNTSLIVRRIEKPNTIYGKEYSVEWHNYHASDILRIKVLIEFGGIYLDRDVYVVQSLDPLRKFEMTIDFEDTGDLGSQVLIAHKNARYLRLFVQTYQKYDKTQWYWSAGIYPVKRIINKYPHLIHRMNGEFGVTGELMCPILYRQNVNDWQKDYYAIHLLMRDNNIYHHKEWCFERQNYPSVLSFDEENVKTLNVTFAQMVRLVLYNTTEIILS